VASRGLFAKVFTPLVKHTLAQLELLQHELVREGLWHAGHWPLVQHKSRELIGLAQMLHHHRLEPIVVQPPVEVFACREEDDPSLLRAAFLLREPLLVESFHEARPPDMRHERALSSALIRSSALIPWGPLSALAPHVAKDRQLSITPLLDEVSHLA